MENEYPLMLRDKDGNRKVVQNEVEEKEALPLFKRVDAWPQEKKERAELKAEHPDPKESKPEPKPGPDPHTKVK